MEKNFMMKDTEAAKFLGLSPQTLRNWRHTCRGPAYVKAGRAVRYDEADLRGFLQARRVVHERTE